MEKYLRILLLCVTISLYSQSDVNQRKYDEMINYFFVGLNEKALEIGVELMSQKEDAMSQEKAIFAVADYFFRQGKSTQGNTEFFAKASFLYSRLLKKFPNTEYQGLATLRLGYLAETNSLSLEKEKFAAFFEKEYNDFYSKAQFLNKLFEFKNINPYEIFKEKDIISSSIKTADKYLSEITVNNPSFDLEVYIYRIFILLDKFFEKGTIKENYISKDYTRHRVIKEFFKGNSGGYATVYNEWKRDKDSLDNMLNYISKKYPSDYRTLTYHFIFAKIFMYEEDDLICNETYRHLNFILENDPNKLSYLYLLTKEFVLNNKFMTK